MTLKKIDYSKLVIYKIVCKDLHITDLYVGGTTNFIQRKKQHKNRCYNKNSEKYYFKLYETIRENGGWENWTMVIIEECPCDDSYNARKLERYYYEQLNATLNAYKPLITEEEKKQEAKEYNKTDKYKESQKKFRDEHREYYKEYEINNKEKIQSRKSEKITCNCGSIISRSSKSAHEKTFLHISKTQSLFTE
jgi:NADH:ubiquinone oxidoreductase subunit